MYGERRLSTWPRTTLPPRGSPLRMAASIWWETAGLQGRHRPCSLSHSQTTTAEARSMLLLLALERKMNDEIPRKHSFSQLEVPQSPSEVSGGEEEGGVVCQNKACLLETRGQPRWHINTILFLFPYPSYSSFLWLYECLVSVVINDSHPNKLAQ